jgi:hypothetical protein
MTMQLMRYSTAVTTAYPPISEDLVRKSLLDAIALCKQVSMEDWSSLTQCAQIIHIHLERRFNAELKALLVGDIGYYSR